MRIASTPPEPLCSQLEHWSGPGAEACTHCPGFSSRSRKRCGRGSFSAFGSRTARGTGASVAEEAGNLLIEEVARAGNLRFSRAGMAAITTSSPPCPRSVTCAFDSCSGKAA